MDETCRALDSTRSLMRTFVDSCICTGYQKQLAGNFAGISFLFQAKIFCSGVCRSTRIRQVASYWGAGGKRNL